jgi:hypothetical protein
MIGERFQDLEDDTGTIDFQGWRCLFCGEISDPVILKNRSNRPKPSGSKNRKLVAGAQ